MPRTLFLALALAVSPAAAQSLQEDRIRYLSGGGSRDALAVMHEAAGEYNLRLRFAAGVPARYVGGANVQVRDRSGDVVFALGNAGPLLYVDLPRGRYIVKAARHGVVRTREFVVGKYSGMRGLIYFPSVLWSGA